MEWSVTVITPTIPSREHLLAECSAAVKALGLRQIIGLDEEHTGPAIVRNHLLDRVTTEWTLFCDDDDLLYPNYLETVGPHLKEDAGVIYTAWEVEGSTVPQPLPMFDGEMLLHRNFIPMTVCARTAAIREVGGFPMDSYNEDHALWINLYRAGYQFVYLPVICWRYRRTYSTRT